MFEVREVGVGSTVTEGVDALVSTHRSETAARRAARQCGIAFRSMYSGGYGYAWLVRRPDGTVVDERGEAQPEWHGMLGAEV